MRNGSLSQLGVSFPEVELYLISKLPNTNNVNKFKQLSIFYPLGARNKQQIWILTMQETFGLLTLFADSW